MGILNATPDSFYGPSRVGVGDARERVERMLEDGADIIDLGAVSTRPGAADVTIEQEWERLSAVLPDVLESLSRFPSFAGPFGFTLPKLSIDTTRAEIVRRVHELAGPFIVNDISSGEDDPEMLPLVGDLGLRYVAMHKRGGPRTMDALTDYPEGVCSAVEAYFDNFSMKAAMFGIKDWILDPGFGFAKTDDQNMELLEGLKRFKRFGNPILVGIADKRFTHGRTEELQRMAVSNGADILRVHEIRQAVGFGSSVPGTSALRAPSSRAFQSRQPLTRPRPTTVPGTLLPKP